MAKTERRRHRRYAISQMVEISLGRERWIHASSVDVSLAGIRCQTTEEMDLGSTVQLSLSSMAGEDHRMEVEAIVIHVEDNGAGTYQAGMSFLSMDPADREILRRYLESLKEGD